MKKLELTDKLKPDTMNAWNDNMDTIDETLNTMNNSIPSKTSDITNDSGFITKTVNNLTNYTKTANSAATLNVSMDTTTYVLTIALKDGNNNIMSTQSVNLPLDSMIVDAEYDSVNKCIILELQGGSSITISVADLVSGLQSEITVNNKLSADLVDDANANNKFVSTQEKTIWNGKQDTMSAGTNISITNNQIGTVGNTVKEITEDKTIFQLEPGIYKVIGTGATPIKLYYKATEQDYISVTSTNILMVSGDGYVLFHENVDGSVLNGKIYVDYGFSGRSEGYHKSTYIQTADLLVTSLSSSSTNTQYPSAKAVYDAVKDIPDLENRIDVLEDISVLKTFTWADIQEIVNKGQASRYFNVGDELTEDWKSKISGTETSYADTPFYIAHMSDHVTIQEDNADVVTNGMYLEWKHTTPGVVPFCAPQCLQCFDGTEGTPAGLPAGNYAFKVKSLPNWATAKTAYQGKYICFTLADAIPSGGCIIGDGWGNNATWKLKTKASHLYNATTSESIDITVESSLPNGYTYLGETWSSDVGYGKLNWPECVPYGDNTWRDSDLRQWLNSNAEAGSWWTRKTRYNMEPETATTYAGFLYGYSNDFVSKLKTVKVGQNTNTRKENEGIVYTYDKIFIASRTQMNTSTENEISIDDIWDYYKALAVGQENLDASGRFKAGETYAILKRFKLGDASSATTFFNRSAYRNYGHILYYCNYSGLLYYYYGASYTYRCLPACVI